VEIEINYEIWVMKIIQFLFCLLVFYSGYSQTVIDVDKNPVPLSNRLFYTTGGFPVSTAKYIRLVAGSPYFSETWMKGTIITRDSIQYSNIPLKLDLLEGSLVYLNNNNEEMISVVPAIKVSLNDTVNGKYYLFVHSSVISSVPPVNGWYQVLTGGVVTLYKQYFKNIYESKAYGSSVTEQTIRTDERYFIDINHTLTRVKKLQDIAELSANKKQELTDYIQKNKLSGKKESDFIAIAEYYNSLK
jgi:hypothetical protein